MVHHQNLLIEKKYILVPDEEPTQGLDDTKITIETKYPSSFTESKNILFKSAVKWN